MRVKKRIPIILKCLESNQAKNLFLETFFKPKIGVQLEIGMPYFEIINMILKWDNQKDNIEKHWLANPDLRLTQVLIYFNIMPSYGGLWYYTEDEKNLIDNKLIEPENIYFWGSNYTKNGKRLNKTKYRLLSELSLSHLENLLYMYNEKLLAIRNDYVPIIEKLIKQKK